MASVTPASVKPSEQARVVDLGNSGRDAAGVQLGVPSERRQAIERLAREWRAGRSVVLCTHVNADGDGCGSETALARILMARGMTVTIVNPTPWPELFRFLLGDDVTVVEANAGGSDVIAKADVIVVMDISDIRRLTRLADAVRAASAAKLVIDHHVPSDDPPGDIIFSDTTACATGELVYDVLRVLGQPLTPAIAQSIYTAILTDTGGFRFGNTSPRAHAIAGELLHAGVDPEKMYQRIYASMPLGRIHLLRDALATLDTDAELGLTWISVYAGAQERYGIRPEDFDGVAEFARSVKGTRMAIFFRELASDRVKISFRATGDVDVNVFANQFGGGGHARASGAMVEGASLAETQERVLTAAREYLRAGAAT